VPLISVAICTALLNLPPSPMGLFGKLFGKKPAPANVPKAPPAPVSPSPAEPSPAPPLPATDAPQVIQIWDPSGKAMQISREDYRVRVLPIQLQKAWNDPDKLATVIDFALEAGFTHESLDAARQLHRIDTKPRRGAEYFANLLNISQDFGEAEVVCSDALRKHGDDAALLVDLAKAQHGLGRDDLAESTLWHALEVDPNDKIALGLFINVQNKRAGVQGGMDAIHKVAALPGSWRPQLWLAQLDVEMGRLEDALALYRQSLTRAGDPVPGDLLLQMSQTLAGCGHPAEALQLTQPRYVAKMHGLMVGATLLKLYIVAGDLAAARHVLNQLSELNRPDWEEQITFWFGKIEEARSAIKVDATDPLQVAFVTIQGPIWLPPSSRANELFPAKDVECVRICFLGCSSEVATNSQRIQYHAPTTGLKLSQQLPLFLSEQVEFSTQARVQTLVPWLTGNNSGFALKRSHCRDDEAAHLARSVASDYMVTTHVKSFSEPGRVDLRLIRAIDDKCLGALSIVFPFDDPQPGFLELTQQLLSLLAKEADVHPATAPSIYQLPDRSHFGSYLQGLNRLLALQCASTEDFQKSFCEAERDTTRRGLQLCLDQPHSIVSRILLAQSLLVLKQGRPLILAEFKDRIGILQTEHPLSKPAHDVVQRMFSDVFQVELGA
jgi:Flp pilus assembly protein TadD